MKIIDKALWILIPLSLAFNIWTLAQIRDYNTDPSLKDNADTELAIMVAMMKGLCGPKRDPVFLTKGPTDIDYGDKKPAAYAWLNGKTLEIRILDPARVNIEGVDKVPDSCTDETIFFYPTAAPQEQ